MTRFISTSQIRRRGLSLLVTSVLLFGLTFVLGTSMAFAVQIRPEIAAFGPDGTSTSVFTENGSLALDQKTKKLFVTAAGPSSGIYGFDASGSLPLPTIGGFSPLSAPPPNDNDGLAVDETALPSAGTLYYSPGIYGPNPFVYGFDSTGLQLGGNFPIDPTLSPGPASELASDICGTAVDSSGNLWVANYGLGRLLEYSSNGAFLKSIDTLGPQGLDACNIAFDSNGDLYAGAGSFPTWKYTAASGYSAATKFDSRTSNAIAVDPVSHHVFIAHGFGNAADITEYDENGNVISVAATPIPEASEGVQDARFTGLAIDPEHDRLYVSDRRANETNGKIRVFGAALTYPDVTLGTASGIENTAATLTGSISAQGVPLTDCHFEYIDTYRGEDFNDLTSGGSVPCEPPAASIPVDSATHSVSATLSGLAPHTPYRFRLVASNANGRIATVDIGSFETSGPAFAETTGSPVRTTTTARLDGRVNPGGAPTTYHFEYGDQGPCSSNPCASTEVRSAGSGNEVVLVSQQIEGLVPHATYHYRLIADNGNPAGGAIGEDMTVTTFDEEAALSHGHFPGPVGSDRAWELVSAPDTGGNPVGAAFAPGAAAISTAGDRAVYGVAGGTPLSETGTISTRLFAERTPTGWETRKIYAPRKEATGSSWKDPAGPDDLSTMIVENDNSGKSGQFSVWRLRPDAAPQKLFGGDVDIRGAGNTQGLLLTAEDGSRAVISLRGPHDPDHPIAAGVKNLYDVISGQPELVSLLPDGSAPACGVPESTNGGAGIPSVADRAARWVSAEGSFLFFPVSCGGPQLLYMRDIPGEETELVSSPPVSGPQCNSYFIKSIPGAAYFFTQSRLVSRDTEPQSCGGANAPGGDVYRYDVEDGSLACITCLTAGVETGVRYNGSEAVIDNSIGVSEDGSRIYFTSSKRLFAGAAKGLYRLDVSSGDLAYVGSFGFIGDFGDSAMTSDGSVVAFRSADPSLNAQGGQQNGGTPQYYRYDDRDRSLICISCPVDGSLPRGAVQDRNVKRFGPGANASLLSADGEDFAFSTPTRLVSADQNTAPSGQKAVVGTDIYEWREGKILLVSDGLINWPAGGEPPEVSAITPSGRDIFFTAAAQYTPDALDGYKRLYDARIGGGFEFARPPKPCPLEVCQGTPRGAPEEQAPGTRYLQGAVGAEPSRARCPKAKVSRKGRCVARHRKHAKKPAQRKRAKHNNRRGSR